MSIADINKLIKQDNEENQRKCALVGEYCTRLEFDGFMQHVLQLEETLEEKNMIAYCVKFMHHLSANKMPVENKKQRKEDEQLMCQLKKDKDKAEERARKFENGTIESVNLMKCSQKIARE